MIEAFIGSNRNFVKVVFKIRLRIDHPVSRELVEMTEVVLLNKLFKLLGSMIGKLGPIFVFILG